jgi:peptide methionine sulfoxide reductase MsrB
MASVWRRPLYGNPLRHPPHVFDDKRYCINGNVLKFVPDAGK